MPARPVVPEEQPQASQHTGTVASGTLEPFRPFIIEDTATDPLADRFTVMFWVSTYLHGGHPSPELTVTLHAHHVGRRS